MIWLVLVEAALELVPHNLQDHPSIVADARRRKKKPHELLLNTNYHHAAMAGLKDKGKRGRPDIVHYCLLNAINTPLNKSHGLLEVCIHVKHPSERMIFTNPKVRIPRSLNRFEGIIAKLLQEGTGNANDGEWLLRVENTTLERFLSRFRRESVHAFSRKGGLKSLDGLIKDLLGKREKLNEDIVFLMGGFQTGEFSNEFTSFLNTDNIHAISPIPLDAWTVVSRIIFKAEEVLESLKEEE
ncbi:MAG: hypothetical protein ACFFCS_21660 [Candidatus Hodarchaeota archaeon]